MRNFMTKILVATDLSPNSTSAVHFAYRLSLLKSATLVIVHVYDVVKPKNWRTHRFETYLKAREQFILNKVDNFLDRIFNAYDEPPNDLELDIQMSPNTVTTILQCANKHKCIYMCIATKGAGKSNHVIGTHAGKLLNKSPIPAFGIPSNYKRKPIDTICYASDMTNFSKEIRKVIEISIPNNIDIKVLHIVTEEQELIKKSTLESRIYRKTGAQIKVKYTERNPKISIIEDIDIAIKKIRPSLVVFFINRSQHYSKSILYDSHVQNTIMFKKIPVLIFKR